MKKNLYIVSYVINSSRYRAGLSETFTSKWRAKLDVWVRRHQKDVFNVTLTIK